MILRIRDVSFYRLPMETRFPFRYGIASLTKLPHLIVTVAVEIDGTVVSGMSADGLPPKWFTKNPKTTFKQDDLPQMLRVIRNAADLSLGTGRHSSFFSWWKDVYDGQKDWAENANIPQLLAGFGVSLLERAVLDAFCRATRTTLHRVLFENLIGVDLAVIRKSLNGVTPRDVLDSQPLDTVILRHTVGLGDPLNEEDVGEHSHPNDGLPFTLEQNIERYGLTHFKIKLGGEFSTDHDRLNQVAEILRRQVGGAARFTLDGNENFSNVAIFREHWEKHRECAAIRNFFDTCLLFVEQPLHREFALVDGVREELAKWPDAPPMIIDESDAEFDSLARARRLGYAGTSHKNCKGIVKGLTNAATVATEKAAGRNAVLSAEDLANVGPVALLQDLAMVASLGIEHAERNGHHYFAGLSMWPSSEQQRVLQHHSDLYSMVNSAPCLAAHHGTLILKSTNEAPFGVVEHPDVDTIEKWDF